MSGQADTRSILLDVVLSHNQTCVYETGPGPYLFTLAD